MIGIDTYHDTLMRGHSVAGFVATLNNTCTRYVTKTAFQGPTEELHNCLQVFMTGKHHHFVFSTICSHFGLIQGS